MPRAEAEPEGGKPGRGIGGRIADPVEQGVKGGLGLDGLGLDRQALPGGPAPVEAPAGVGFAAGGHVGMAEQAVRGDGPAGHDLAQELFVTVDEQLIFEVVILRQARKLAAEVRFGEATIQRDAVGGPPPRSPMPPLGLGLFPIINCISSQLIQLHNASVTQ